MTAIASMEELLAVENGGVVTVGHDRQNPWARVPEGFRRGDFTVPAEFFEGEVSQNRVVLGVTPTEGQLWLGDRYNYDHLIVRDHGDGFITTARLNRGTSMFRSFIKYRATDMPGQMTADTPEWVATLLPVLRSLHQSQETATQHATEVMRLREEQAALREQNNQELQDFKASITTALHAFMGENNMEGNSPLADVLEANGLERPKQTIQVAFSGRVYATVNIPQQAVIDAFNEGFSGSAENISARDSSSIYTSADLTITLPTEVEHGTCACSTKFIRDRHVLDWLRENSTLRSVDSVSGRITCEAVGCGGRSVAY